MKWNYEGTPSEPGWYATLICHDPYEGIFPTGTRWNGNYWTTAHVIAFGDFCITQKAAIDLSYANDPEPGYLGCTG